MNAPTSTVQGRTGKRRAIPKLAPRLADNTHPEYTSALNTRYLGLEKRKVEQLGQLQSIGAYTAYAPKSVVPALRKVNEDSVMNPHFGFHLRPNLGPSVYTANPLHWKDLLAFQKRTRYHDGNVDWKQKPLWTGFNERKLT